MSKYAYLRFLVAVATFLYLLNFYFSGLTQCLMLMIFIALVYPKAESLSSAEKDKIERGLTSGKEIVDFISKKEFTKTLTKIASSIGPYLGALGPFIGLLLAFIPSESAELQFMKQMMKNIDNRFDRVDYRFDNIERKIDWSSVKVNFGQIEQKIRVMSKEVKHLYEVPKSAVANRKTLFIQHYNSDYQNSGSKLYDAVMLKQGVFQENICASVMKYTANNRKETQEFMLGILRLLMKAVRIELSYLRANNFHANELYMKTKWEARFKQVKVTFESVDSTVRNKYHVQSGYDTSKLAAVNKGMSNKQFAAALFRMLAGKYYWRDWIVVVYKELWGYDNHCVSVCGGHIKFRTQGRNILIASVDRHQRIMDLARAERDMRHVAMTSRHGNWWTGYYNKKRWAKDIYNSLNKSGACSVGVIKWNSNLYYHYQAKRFKYVSRSPYFNLHMWG